jgi:excisionase family DNA binding protein
MKEMLTARQVQDTLKVDRTTIYRMLKDGRLKGVKVGNHWRFPLDEVEEITSGNHSTAFEKTSASAQVLPLKNVSAALEVFAEMAEIGALVTDSQGSPLSRVCNSCRFCNLIQTSNLGQKDCLDSWRRLAKQTGESPEFITCHAGLLYARARINVNNETIAMLVAGQFHTHQHDPGKSLHQNEALARKYHLDIHQLNEAAQEIRVLDEPIIHQIGAWLSTVARIMGQFSNERADMLSRLHQIAEMSAIAENSLE